MKRAPNKPQKKPDVSILVVDDREDNLFSIEAILEKDNYNIVKANSGKAALKVLLKEHDFSLILMDVQMPELNGFETATIIYDREKLREIPIIFITAFSNDEEYVFRGYKMGAVDYIYKPIDPDLLRAKVGVFIELYRKTRQVQLLNEQLIQSNENLRQKNEELDQFAYMASHDLQEPLRKIQMFSDKIILKKDQDPDTERYFSKIINASRRMQTLINNLLDFSRHSVRATDFRKTDLNVLLKEVLGELEFEIEKAAATIHAEPLPVIWAEPGLMQQLFFNILGNAIKFRKQSEPLLVNIAAEKMENPDLPPVANDNSKINYYRITISDNGIGFDNKQSLEIFKVFKRLHSFQEFEGSGVGLSICKKIVEKHAGFISGHGEKDKGAIFTIILPEKQLRPGPAVSQTTEQPA